MTDGTCKLEIPIMACPDVQPPAQRVPNPTIKPPITKNINPFKLKIFSVAKISEGIKPLKSLIPKALKSLIVCGLITIELGFAKKLVAIKPPINTPKTKTKFQISLRQLYLKNGISAGIQAAQICRNDEDIPNDLFPINSRVGTVSPIKGPATYQGHGCLMNSSSSMIMFKLIMNNVYRLSILFSNFLKEYRMSITLSNLFVKNA